MVQWLGFCTFSAGAWVQSLVRELRFHKPHAKKKKKVEDHRGKRGIVFEQIAFHLPDTLKAQGSLAVLHFCEEVSGEPSAPPFQND